MEDEKEFNVYNEEARGELVDADEIDGSEEGFMKGYEEDVNPSKCSNCGKVLTTGDFIEETIEGESHRFCSDDCATKFELKKEHV